MKAPLAMTSRIHIQEETRACSRQRSQALIERLSLGRFATYDQITANLWVSILFQLTIHDTTPSKNLVNAQTRIFDNGGQRDITNGRSSGFPVSNNQPYTIIDVVASMMERYSDVRGSIAKITSDGASCLVFVAKEILSRFNSSWRTGWVLLGHRQAETNQISIDPTL